MRLRKTFLLFGYLLTCLLVAGQQRTLLFNHLNVNNGLSQGVNNCIYKDSRGYVWISSFDGLNRYDGITCTIFREIPGDSSSIAGTLFLNIAEDKNSNLWIGSNKGLNCYNRSSNRFIHYQMPGRKKDEQIFSPFYIDDNNSIWFQSGQDIIRFDQTKKEFKLLQHFTATGNLFLKTIPAEPFKKLQSIYAIVNKTAQVNKGTITNDNIQWAALFNDIPTQYQSFNCLLPSATGLWIGTDNGLIYAGSNGQSSFIHLYNNKPVEAIQSLAFDKKGTLWAGSLQQGLFAVDTGTIEITGQYFSSSRNPYTLSGNQVQYLFTDNENHLWASVWGKGIDYVSLGKFRFQHHLTKEEAEQLGINNFIRSIVQTDDNHFWCGTQSGGIIILDKEKRYTGIVSPNLPPAIEHLYKDGKGNIWAATFSGLFIIEPKSKKIKPVDFSNMANSPGSMQFNFVTEIENGIMLASSNTGLFIGKEQNNQYVFSLVKGLPANDVYLTSFIDKQGNVYVSRAFKGFMIGSIQNDSFAIKKEFPYQSTIKCFTETNDIDLYIGSTIGLIKFNKKLFGVEKIYTTSNGLSNQYIYGVLAVTNALWISTNAGINRLQLSNESIKSFNAGDGLQSNEFNTYSFCKSSSGELLFGGVNGLNSFYPQDIQPYRYAPQLQLSALQINDAASPLPTNSGELSNLILAPNDNTVSFQFTVLDYANPSANTLYYTLEGYDRKWIATANKSVIRYANLPPGNYTLLAKAINSEQVESHAVYRLPVTVKTPWFKTIWFRICLAVAIISLLWILIKIYLHQQLQKQRTAMEKELAIEQERNRMARELHDGMGSMLSGIKHSFDGIKNDLPLNDVQQKGFENNIEKLNDSIRELRNISHSMASVSLLHGGLEASLQDYCNSFSQPGKLKINFESLHLQNLDLKEEQSFHILRIIQELVHNIIKHAGATEAIVQVILNNNILYITVEDNGKGFSKDAQPASKGVGLKNISSRVKILKGKIDIRSNATEGTSILIEIPAQA